MKESNKRNLDFNLELKDIKYTGKCLALGIDLEVGGKTLDNSPTLDRLNPKKGYIKGNVKVISHLANRIKNSASLDDILKIAKYIKKYS